MPPSTSFFFSFFLSISASCLCFAERPGDFLGAPASPFCWMRGSAASRISISESVSGDRCFGQVAMAIWMSAYVTQKGRTSRSLYGSVRGVMRT